MNEGVSALLGLRLPEPLQPMSLLHEVEEGLPLASVDRVAQAIAPGDVDFTFRIVPRATLARLRKAGSPHDAGKTGQAHRSRATVETSPASGHATRLSAEQSARVARLAAVWSFAREVWGSDAEARQFLFRPHPLLEGRRPIDVVLSNEFGRPIVEDILGRLRHGSAV